MFKKEIWKIANMQHSAKIIVLKNEIENRLQVITDRLITLKEAGITL